MKKLHQQYSHQQSKVWTSLDCLLITVPITPLSRSSLYMRSNIALQMTDTRRLSPQTTSSSGYHSDLSSTNESPQSIHENLPVIIEQSTSLPTEKKINKNLSRLSNFLRKQYERAKLILISPKQHSSSSITCSKATSTTPLPDFSENNPKKSQQSSLSVSRRSSFIEPIYSIYVRPSYDKQVKIPLKNSTSIHQCNSHHLLTSSKVNKSQVNSHAYRRLVALSNYENSTTEYSSNNPNKYCHHYYVKPRYSQNYYPYKYLNKNYECNRSTYAPLSDFISTTNSAFKPIKSYRHSLCHTLEEISPSNDPCDLEVAQYFHQTPQWSNPNYFNVYTKEMSMVSPRKNYIETLC